MSKLSTVRALAPAIGLVFALTASACHEQASKEDCEAAAKRRARYFFGAKREKDTGSERQTRRAAKLEFEASMKDCLSSWSTKKARCVAKSKNRNMMISCK